MARIRSIKPEFWDSPSTAKAGPWARLLYMAMWNWADDWGIGDGNLVRLEAFAFPNDGGLYPASDGDSDTPPRNFRGLVSEVQNAYEIVFFEHLGRPYYYIPKWEDHQRTEKRSKPRDDLIAAAKEACNDSKYEPELPLVTESPRKVAESPTLEVGSRNRGTGEQGKGKVTRANARDTDELPPVFVEFSEVYPGNVPTKPALAAWTAAVKRTKGQPQKILDGATALAKWAADSGTESKFIRNAVKWLNEDGWLDKLAPVGRASPPSNIESHVALVNQLAAREANPQQRQIGAGS